MGKPFTSLEDQFIRENYLVYPAKKISKMLGRSESAALNRMKLIGLKVPDDIKEKFKRDSQLKKGHTAYNKGKKWEETFSPETIQKLLKSRHYKKGMTAYANCDLFEVRTVTLKRTEKKFEKIKIGKNNWIPLKRFIWEQHNGPVPAKMYLAFKDNNYKNCVVDNLELRAYAEVVRANNYMLHYPKPLARLIHLKSRVTISLNILKKQNHEKEPINSV